MANKKKPILLDKKVQIAPIERANNISIKNQYGSVDISEATMLTGSSRSIVLPTNRRTGRLVDPLTKEEREFLEEELKMDLSVYAKEDNFWKSGQAIIKLHKTSRNLNSAVVELNLNDPYDFLLYKIALVSGRVSNSWEDRYDKADYEFVIKDLDSEHVEELKFTEIQDVVLEFLLKNKSNRSKLRGLLRIYGGTEQIPRGIGPDTRTDFIYNELRKLTRSNKSVQSLYNILDLDEATYEMKVFIEDAIAAGSIEKFGTTYKLQGGDTIGYGVEEVVAFLSEKKNQDIKLRVKNQIDKHAS